MPGFLGIYNAENRAPITKHTDLLVTTTLQYENLWIQARTNNKFYNDKLFYDDSSFIIIIEGVIFNKTELLNQFRTTSLPQLIRQLFEKVGESFFSCFRGSFSGLFYDKLNRILIVFTDQIGDKPIFYSQLGSQLFFGSELKYITELFNAFETGYTLDISGAYSCLTYGYMISDLTYLDGVKRLRGGNFIRITNSSHLSIKEYHQFQYCPNYSLSDKIIIEEVDYLFNCAVKSQIEKNNEYGYDDYASLSAGLDSRMTTFAISQLKKTDFTSFTYSPVGFHDQVTSAAIARHLNNKYLYKCNNTGDLLLDIDGSIFQNEGLYMYFGAAVLLDFFKNIETSRIGIIHSGQIGDAILGCFSRKPGDRFVNLKYVDMHSRKLGDQFYEHFAWDKYQQEFPDREIFSLYNRGFMGVNSGAPLVFQRFAETYSPFCDVEFCEFCLTIPLEKRVRHYIYDKWIMSRYPEAAKFRHNGVRIIGSPFNDVRETFIRVQRKFGKTFQFVNAKKIQSVTPLHLWCSNDKIKIGLDAYFNRTLVQLEKHPALLTDCRNLYETGNALEKNQVLTLLGAVELLLS